MRSLLPLLLLPLVVTNTNRCNRRYDPDCVRFNQRQRPIRRDGDDVPWDKPREVPKGKAEWNGDTREIPRPAVEDIASEKGSMPMGSIPLGSLAGGSTLVAEVCRDSTDCVQGALCEDGRCKCMLSHVEVESYCWKRINPEQSGCTYDAQCEAVSPGSRCVFSICRCSGNRAPSATREGPVCHPQGHCPTNGANSLLYNRNSASLAQCFFFDGEADRRAGKFIGCDDFPEVYDCIDGLCCPTRALTCIQPVDPGDDIGGKANGTHQAPLMRWFFNPVTFTCERFDFSGVGGNSNNFMTLAHCESYCALRCPRGQPQLEISQPDGDPLSSLAVSCLDDKSACDGDRFTCTHLHSNAFCCPSPSFICSEFGGLSEETVDLVSQPLATPYSAGSNRQGQASVTRWYWNREERRCRSFRYFGQGGNFNNFLSEQHCNDFCTKSLCPFGTALKDTAGAHIQCSSSSQCPRSHSCSGGVCCPSPATICNQPLATGSPCSALASQRYWFNSATRTCQPFSFSGCDGNNNNFRSMSECTVFCGKVQEEPKCPVGDAMKLEDGKYWRCDMKGKAGGSEQNCPTNYECHFDGKTHGCCPMKMYTCRLLPDEGRACNGMTSTRWHYDYTARSCRAFEYKGCDGNSNNFLTQAECAEHCGVSGCPNGGDIHRLDGEDVRCHKDSQCPSGHSCTSLILPGLNPEDMFCCPSRTTICNEAVDAGFSCAEPTKRYYFDATTRICRPFTFRGCGGNSNNFATKLACINVCMAAACAPSEMAYQSASSDTPFDCTTKACPRGYLCVLDPFSPDRKVCCGAPNMGVCPSNQRPLLDYRNQRPLSCSSMKANDCPSRFRCTFNGERSEHFCCAEQQDQPMCPSGARLLKDAGTASPVGCNVDSSCPEGAACHRPDPFNTGVCCHNLDNVCPPMFTLERELTDSKECSPFVVHSCSESPNVVCLFSEKLDRFVCCKRDSGKGTTENPARCPANTVQDEERTTCSSTMACPPPYFCIRPNSERVGVCCKHPRAIIAPPSTEKKEETEKSVEVEEKKKKSEKKDKEKEKEMEKNENTDKVEKDNKKTKSSTEEDDRDEEDSDTEAPKKIRKKPKKKKTTRRKEAKAVSDIHVEEEEEDEEETDISKEEVGRRSLQDREHAHPFDNPSLDRRVELPRGSLPDRDPSKSVAPSTHPPPPVFPSPASSAGPLLTTTLHPAKAFGVECPPLERPLLDRMTGRPALCADSVPCPSPYICRPHNVLLSICCAPLRPMPPITVPSYPTPGPIPQLPVMPPPPPPMPGMPHPQPNTYIRPQQPNSLPPPMPHPGGMNTLTLPSYPNNPYQPPPPPQPPQLPPPPPPPVTIPSVPTPQIDRGMPPRRSKETISQSCPEGMVPFSTDGQVHSCVNAHCPPKYKCVREVCCPVRHLACQDPVFHGTECRDPRLDSGATRYYYDSTMSECRPFEFRGCNPGSNHFLDLLNCERACLPDDEEEDRKNTHRGEEDKRDKATTTSFCPPPYVNPKDTPQICSPFFDSCAGNQKCLPSKKQHYICCAQPSSTSLRSLIARMCGDGYRPVMSQSGDPRRCDPSRMPCSRRDECRFSTVLMIDICCQPDEISEPSDSYEMQAPAPQSKGRLRPTVFPRLSKLRSGGFPRIMWSDDESIRICRPGEREDSCLPRLHPGQTGCVSESQCLGDSTCSNGRCKCENGAFLYRALCVSTCPTNYRIAGGVCVSNA